MQVSPSPAAHLLHVLLIYYSSTKPSINLHLLHLLHMLHLLDLLQQLQLLYYSFTTSTADLYLLRLLKLTQLNYNISCKHKYKHPTVQPRICCSLQLRFKRESVEFFRARKKCSGLSVYSLPGWGIKYLVKIGWVGQQNGYPKPYCSKKFIYKLDVRTQTSPGSPVENLHLILKF